MSLERDWPPPTTDYWANDKRGDPLFVVTAEANAGLTRMLPRCWVKCASFWARSDALRWSLTVGWSPQLFRELLALDFDILTYRKGRTRRIAEARFTSRKARLDGPCASSKENFASARSLA
jgi:hypothetical protein